MTIPYIKSSNSSLIQQGLCLNSKLFNLLHLHIIVVIIIIIIMKTHILNLALLLSLYMCHAMGMAVERNMLETVTEVGSDCVLECTAKYTPGVQYRAVRWYKVEESSQLSGLLTKDLPNGTTRWYTGVDREVDLLGETRNILLPNVTCADRGVYVCHLAAPVGEQNREGQVVLTLTDCVDISTEAVIMADTFLVISASVVLMLALVIFFISYGSLKKILRRQTNKTPKKETLLDAPLKPLEKKDLKLIYTLGPKVSKSSTVKNICV